MDSQIQKLESHIPSTNLISEMLGRESLNQMKLSPWRGYIPQEFELWNNGGYPPPLVLLKALLQIPSLERDLALKRKEIHDLDNHIIGPRLGIIVLRLMCMA
jgi:hypothetical protein